MNDLRYSEYLKQFKTEVAKEIDVDLDAQKNSNKNNKQKNKSNSPFDRGKHSNIN